MKKILAYVYTKGKKERSQMCDLSKLFINGYE
jgi:hypothetical protein